MKKLIVLSAIAALTSGAALADTDGLALSGTVEAVCEVSINDQTVEFDFDAGVNTGMVTFRYECNSSGGATMTMSSLNAGLMHGGNSLNYRADISTITTPALFNFGIDTDLANTNSHTLPGSPELADPTGQDAQIDITVDDTPTFAGNYTDTLTVTLAAN